MSELEEGRRRELVEFFERRIPFNVLLKLKIEALSKGRCVVRLPWAEHLIGDPIRRALHGGTTSTLVDTCGGLACFSMLDGPRDRLSTVDLRVDYLRPGPAEADVLCVGEVVRMGNKVAVARMSAYSGGVPPAVEDRPFATGQGVYNLVLARR